MEIVETESDLQKVLVLVSQYPSIIFPLMSDLKTHPTKNRVCLFFVETNNQQFIIPLTHNEATTQPRRLFFQIIFAAQQNCMMPFPKQSWHLIGQYEKVHDLSFVEHNKTGEVKTIQDFFTLPMKTMINLYGNVPNLVEAMPLVSLIECCQQYADHLRQFTDFEDWNTPDAVFHKNIILITTMFLEFSGVHVDSQKFLKEYGEHHNKDIHNELVYSEYNPYTTTRRVTNRYGGINYSAIEKGERRQVFTSRYGTNGQLLLVDWESFHVRLIGDLIGYKFPDEPLHQFFAKQYFQTESVTEQQYQDGKLITFQNLYGQGDSSIEFFVKVREYVTKISREMVNNGVVVTPESNQLFLKNIDNPNPGKIFNYLLQLRETEVALRAINNFIFSCLKYNNFGCKVTLYTYDSILLDVNNDELAKVIKILHDKLEYGGKYPIRIYSGQNYDEMQLIS